MDTTAIYLLIFVLSVAFLYNQITTRIPSRLRPDQAPKARLGLVPVCANGLPTRAGGIDIIFVHGLGSNPDTTWQAKRPLATTNTPDEVAPLDSGPFVNWISDFLPDDLPPATRRDIRLFCYNYDSYWKRDAVHTRLANLGSEFLEQIREIRVSEAERSRDLIFVGYSYGGLVVKQVGGQANSEMADLLLFMLGVVRSQFFNLEIRARHSFRLILTELQALVQARGGHDLGYITEHTKAILFLGTPHRGSSFSRWGWLAAQALWPAESNPLILANLEYDSTSLLDLHRAFTGIQGNWRVYNFFEQRRTQIFTAWFIPYIRWRQFCVREPSATYEGPNIRNIGIPVDHSGLNKFGSRSQSYQAILSKLVEATTSLAHSLKHHYAVPLERVHTYIERAELSKEIEQKLHKRHEEGSVPYAVALHGLGGVGKSQLALDYTEKHKDRYNPIFWIDATDEETVRSSFRRCASELGLPEERVENQGSVLTDAWVQAVLRWLRGRTEAEEKWLMVVDNADDVSWGLQKIMPKGGQGSILITSRDKQSTRLVSGACEQVRVDTMSPAEGSALLLRHLQIEAQSAPESVQRGCEKVVQMLGDLALAIDLAGAYIGNDPQPEQALLQYIEDYDRHCNDLLRMDNFRGLLPTEKTVWTVWETTLDKITAEYAHLQPVLLLTFLAQFKGTLVQDEMLRLASLGMAAVDAEINDGADDRADARVPTELQQFFLLKRGDWDSFRYRQARDILIRYSLLQRVEGKWAGVTMHSMVQWRAIQDGTSRPWRWWYMVIVLAACCQIQEEQRPEFRRHLVVHLPGTGENYGDGAKMVKEHKYFIGTTFGRIYYYEGWWDEAEKLVEEVMEMSKTKLGTDHPSTLTSMANLASTYRNQGRWKDAEELFVQVMEMSKTKLGADHPNTLTSMANLAFTWKIQGRHTDALALMEGCAQTRQRVLGPEHPDITSSLATAEHWSN